MGPSSGPGHYDWSVIDWAGTRAQPVPYFHLVFTLPEALRPLCLRHPQSLYTLLFRTVADTLLQAAADKRHLSARIGFLALLLTWTQTLLYHPQLHVVVPGGGLTPDGARWVSSRPDYFLPVQVLSRLFRGKLLESPCRRQALLHRPGEAPR